VHAKYGKVVKLTNNKNNVRIIQENLKSRYRYAFECAPAGFKLYL
jgi:hypothetical protein